MVFMSTRKVLNESDCDYSIKTYVGFGKKIKDVPSGWALNLLDIRDFIPVLRYEFEGYVMIKSIISPCRIRINPRLFYSSVSLKDYLRSQKALDNDKKISVEIKFNKKKLDEYHNEFSRKNLDYVDTKLLVGKSYSSKGWGLAKDVVSKIFPLDAYNFNFPVYIDDIPVDSRINIQTRLFYSSNELSAKLEKLSRINPKQKVDARIIIDEEYFKLVNSFREQEISDKSCIVCGMPLYKDSKSSKCNDCLDKELTVLKLKNLLDFYLPEDGFYEEDLLELGFTKGQISIMLHKLEKYSLILKEWDDRFIIQDKNVINNFISKWGK